MPAAIRTRPRRPDLSDVTRYLSVRLRRSPIGGFRRSVDRATRASLCARHRQRPGSRRARSNLTFRQPFSASLAALDGPCDRGNVRPTLRAADGFLGSHGRTEEEVNALRLTSPYRSTGSPVQSIFFFFSGAWLAPSRCHARPARGRDASPSRSNRPREAAARATCPNRSREALRRPIESAAAGPRSGTIRERGRLCESCPQISWHVSQRRGRRGPFR
jgi:hypothetical protein